LDTKFCYVQQDKVEHLFSLGLLCQHMKSGIVCCSYSVNRIDPFAVLLSNCGRISCYSSPCVRTVTDSFSYAFLYVYQEIM